MNILEMEFKEKTGLRFEQFYKEQKPKLVWFLAKWTKDLSLAEDLANDSFIKALESIDSYNGEKSQAHTWLFTIATNIVRKDYNEKKKTEILSLDKEMGNGANLALFIPVEDPMIELNRQKVLNKRTEIVRDVIFDMPEKHHKYKTVLIMRELKNMSYRDITDSLGINENTIKSQIKKGREILRKKVEKKFEYLEEHGID